MYDSHSEYGFELVVPCVVFLLLKIFIVLFSLCADRSLVGRTASHQVRVLAVPVVRHRLADGHRPVQPDVRAQDIDQHLHGAAGVAHRRARVLGMQPVAGQRVPADGHDGQRRVHVRPVVHHGGPVAQLC